MVNYAEAYGIHSLAAAIVFTLVWGLLTPFFVFKSVTKPTFVYFILTLFCILRVVAFAIRADLAHGGPDSEKLGMLVANQVLYNAGFFGLLYSMYTLILDRQIMVGIEDISNPITLFTGNRHLVRMVLSAAVALGIVGAIDTTSSDVSSQNLGKTLRTVSYVLYLVFIAVAALHLTLFVLEKRRLGHQSKWTGNFGRENGTTILYVVIVLVFIREIFFVATIQNTKQATNEHLFYPLSAVTEVLAVLLLTIPGLVPTRKELPPSNETGIIFIDLYNQIKRNRAEASESSTSKV